jgi:chemotaxis response regulator CheB
MPRAAIQIGAAKHVLSVEQIGPAINQRLGSTG